mgnify:CR=1 FL=1
MQESRCFTQIYADLARRFAQIMFPVDLREILFPGLLMQESRCFTQIYADLARRFAQIRFPVNPVPNLLLCSAQSVTTSKQIPSGAGVPSVPEV